MNHFISLFLIAVVLIPSAGGVVFKPCRVCGADIPENEITSHIDPSEVLKEDPPLQIDPSVWADLPLGLQTGRRREFPPEKFPPEKEKVEKTDWTVSLQGMRLHEKDRGAKCICTNVCQSSLDRQKARVNGSTSLRTTLLVEVRYAYLTLPLGGIYWARLVGFICVFGFCCCYGEIFFYTVGFGTPNFDCMRGNVICRHVVTSETLFGAARNLLRVGPASHALQVIIPPVRRLLFNFWATTEVRTGTRKNGKEYTFVHGFIHSLIDQSLEAFSFTLTDLRTILKFPGKPAGAQNFEPVPSNAELITFMNSFHYNWRINGKDQLPDKCVNEISRSRMSAEMAYIFTHVIQGLTDKVGSLEQGSTAQVQIFFSLIKNMNIDFAKIIFDDLISRLKKGKGRKETVLYPRFLSTIFQKSLDEDYPAGDLSYHTLADNILVSRDFLVSPP
ncbi:hypothetical protein OSB04_004490 [Centaurea solstitialis]|uniref:Uncharacterized protein n=1 Tax=Centaurea solstitialis TaxID=347529 RepID=A0AA38TYM1_9ASTR|nr:hypothetical protein OSB04_004490 [Centaurea solstitialis]